MTQEIRGNKISPTPLTKLLWGIAAFTATSWLGWVSITLINVSEHFALHPSLEQRVESLEDFAMQGDRFTRQEGDLLETKVAANKLIIERLDERLIATINQQGEIKASLRRIEAKLDRLIEQQ